MFKAFRDPSFQRLFIGAALLLGALVFVSYRLAWPTVSAGQVAGTYHRAPVSFLHVDHLPQTFMLHGDGTLELLTAQGMDMGHALWTWDEVERMVRVDDPRWDRQIRMRSTLSGPQLCVRISELPFEIDHPEHDEEVDLIKDDAAGSASGE